MPSYYHYEIWKNSELLQKSYDLYEDLTDICDQIDIMIYNYIGEMVKVDRYPAARSMLPRDSVLYYKAQSGEEFHISMMEVAYPKGKCSSCKKRAELRGGFCWICSK